MEKDLNNEEKRIYCKHCDWEYSPEKKLLLLIWIRKKKYLKLML